LVQYIKTGKSRSASIFQRIERFTHAVTLRSTDTR